EVPGDVRRQVAQLDDGRLGRAAETLADGLRETVGQQAGRGRLGQPSRDDGELHALTSFGFFASRAATREAWVGASGTSAGRPIANSLRSTGTTSSPRMSSCSSTVFSGSPAWSIRNSCRWQSPKYARNSSVRSL